MKKLGLTAILVVLMAFVAVAQEKIVVIDYAYCIRTSAAGKKAQAELQKLQETRNASLKTLADELKKMEADYIAQEKLLDDNAKRTKLAAYKTKVGEYEQKVRQAQTDLAAKDQELTAKTTEALNKTVAAYAKEKGYTIVLQKQAAAYIAPSVVDISADIVKRFDSGK
jgi:outer membrane protein